MRVLTVLSAGIMGLGLLWGGSAAVAAEPVIMVHGGVSGSERDDVPRERRRAWARGLEEALDAGYEVLEDGGSALDAVIAAAVLLEDNPTFNAGKGAVYNAEGDVELDSSIMDGATLNTGAVAGVRRIKNPITLARAVMENSRHVMFVGDGAEQFARSQGFEMWNPDYFRTDRVDARYQRAIEAQEAKGDDKKGTIGVIALDQDGNLAAGTSTGGLMMKRFGRVGDSPIIGAGTYANNASCAVSATGTGEYFIRTTAARDICSLVEYKGMSIGEAAATVIGKIQDLGGDGGVIVLDADGNTAAAFNTKAMIRGHKKDGRTRIRIFDKD